MPKDSTFLQTIFGFAASKKDESSREDENNYTPILLQEFLARKNGELPSDKKEKKEALSAAKKEYLEKSPQEKSKIFASWLAQLPENKRWEFIEKYKLPEDDFLIEKVSRHLRSLSDDPNIGSLAPTRGPTRAPTKIPSPSPTLAPSFEVHLFTDAPSFSPSVGIPSLSPTSNSASDPAAQNINPYLLGGLIAGGALICIGAVCIGYCALNNRDTRIVSEEFEGIRDRTKGENERIKEQQDKALQLKETKSKNNQI